MVCSDATYFKRQGSRARADGLWLDAGMALAAQEYNNEAAYRSTDHTGGAPRALIDRIVFMHKWICRDTARPTVFTELSFDLYHFVRM